VTIVSGSRPPAARLYRERGAGNQPTIVIGGFVPDATEVVEFQRPLLKQSGALYYLNYPREGFHLPLFQAQLADLVESLNLRGERPVLLGVSFGAGLVAGFLRDVLPLDGLAIRGALFVSPVFCAEDLVRPDRERTGGVRMLESNLRRILSARHD
jgi:pimeloyl-ACP methyl ester carboxylesterase